MYIICILSYSAFIIHIPTDIHTLNLFDLNEDQKQRQGEATVNGVLDAP